MTSILHPVGQDEAKATIGQLTMMPLAANVVPCAVPLNPATFPWSARFWTCGGSPHPGLTRRAERATLNRGAAAALRQAVTRAGTRARSSAADVARRSGP